ncbi:hypothetical protein P879_00267 [Paragonimus westermani]|uniref:mRNA-decapping enzyme C-terminal domain-containing protein n=1 Tax=Paragonimus westermani TaxID=34504 RepID=A0A8T0DXV4_9TREM|nr:hypothetical protein P879_00267 [Paragonimus westermani]
MAEEEALNVSVIQSYDQFCTHITDKSSSAHVYYFQNESKSWVKSKIGGVFFLYKRSKVPFDSFMILNRKSHNMNQLEFVTSSLQIQLHSPFLLYRTGKGTIFSIWFFSPEDCVRIAERIGKMIFDLGGSGLRAASETSQDHKGFPQLPPESVSAAQGLNQLLNIIRSSGDVQNSKTQTTSKNRIRSVTTGKRLEEDSDRTNRSDTKKNPNILDLLQKAEVDFNSGVLPAAEPNNESSIDTVLQRLRTACNINPAVSVASSLTVKSVQKKSTSPASPVPTTRSGNHISVTELEQQLLHDHQSISPCYDFDEATDESSNGDKVAISIPSTFRSVNASVDRVTVGSASVIPIISQTSDLDAGYADDIDEEDSCPGVLGAPLSGYLRSSAGVFRKQRRHARHRETSGSVEEQSLPRPASQSLDRVSPAYGYDREKTNISDYQEEPLVTPAMLTTPSAFMAFNRSRISPTVSVATVAHSEILSPSTDPSKLRQPSNLHGLSKDQMREALVYLLENDDEFLNQLHSAYLKSLQHRLSK